MSHKQNSSSQQSDLLAIEALHQADMAASKIRDYETLMSLMTEDCILMPPGEEAIRGMPAIQSMMKASQESETDDIITEYVHEFEEIYISGDVAYEWGIYRGAYKTSPEAKEVTEQTRLFRILRKQADGSWKVARAIWQEMSVE